MKNNAAAIIDSNPGAVFTFDRIVTSAKQRPDARASDIFRHFLGQNAARLFSPNCDNQNECRTYRSMLEETIEL
jgi:hypothetical protein